MPALLAVLCVLGLIENFVARRRHFGLRRAGLMVKKTANVSGWVGVMCSAWAVMNWLASPPEAHAAFAMIIAMGALATAYCLSAIRFAAILNRVIGVVPISALMLLSGRPAEIAAATSLVLATLILVRFIPEGHAMLVDLLQLQHQTRDLAHTDPLTGLANRRALDERIAGLLAKGEGAPPFRLALLDLDGFGCRRSLPCCERRLLTLQLSGCLGLLLADVEDRCSSADLPLQASFDKVSVEDADPSL